VVREEEKIMEMEVERAGEIKMAASLMEVVVVVIERVMETTTSLMETSLTVTTMVEIGSLAEEEVAEGIGRIKVNSHPRKMKRTNLDENDPSLRVEAMNPWN